MSPKPQRDSLVQVHQIGCLLYPALIAFFGMGAAGIGLIERGVFFGCVAAAYIVIRMYDRSRAPYKYARDPWDKREMALYERSLLERRDRVLQISPRDLEHAVARLFTHLGYRAHVTQATADGGWDVELLDSSGGRTLIECKRYHREKAVGRPALQKLHSAMITEGAVGATCVTTSYFSAPAIEFARAQGITLVDGMRLGVMMIQAYGEEHEKYVRGLCRICGETSNFDPEVGWPIKRALMWRSCPNGHMVKHPLVIDGHPVVVHAEQDLKVAGRWTVA